mmetsp:Transcript_36369/g.91485  ORF Transcript_36369/g.91485 Transcript_36369/m.91485 type:complete len:156 (-) Transcript_36369:1402-1869(-)
MLTLPSSSPLNVCADAVCKRISCLPSKQLIAAHTRLCLHATEPTKGQPTRSTRSSPRHPAHKMIGQHAFPAELVPTELFSVLTAAASFTSLLHQSSPTLSMPLSSQLHPHRDVCPTTSSSCFYFSKAPAQQSSNLLLFFLLLLPCFFGSGPCWAA